MRIIRRLYGGSADAYQGRMESSVISITVKLEIAFRRDGRDWLAWCLPIDVMTQARTKKQALVSLKAAVELWFESCIKRGVLDKALQEAGFSKAPLAPGEDAKGFNFVHVVKSPGAEAGLKLFSHSRTHGAEYIKVSIPAYIAAQQLRGAARASR